MTLTHRNISMKNILKFKTTDFTHIRGISAGKKWANQFYFYISTCIPEDPLFTGTHLDILHLTLSSCLCLGSPSLRNKTFLHLEKLGFELFDKLRDLVQTLLPEGTDV